MKKALLTLAGSVIAIGIISGTAYSDLANAAEPQTFSPALLPTIRPLLRQTKTIVASSPPQTRDPFSAGPVEIQPARDSASAIAPRAPITPAMPALNIIGKQQDDHGWAVYIAQAGSQGAKGQVWVVRQGETFDERFRVSKLQPPVLVITSLRGHQTKTFDIGSDEE